MSKLEPLRSDHADAVLAFERDNRTYLATSISDRGDDFFDHFDAHFHDSLAEQDARDRLFFLRLDDDGEVIPADRSSRTSPGHSILRADR